MQELIVQGLGRNIFSFTSLSKTGLRCVVEDKTPHLTIRDAVISLTHTRPLTPRHVHARRLFPTDGHQPSGITCAGVKLDIFRERQPSCSVAVSADSWHRRLGHIDPRSMDVLRKDPDAGVAYNGNPSPFHVCQIGKHKQCSHPKQSTRELSRPAKIVVIDNMGPVDPHRSSPREACLRTHARSPTPSPR